jgi:hypothetical protein
MSLNLPSTAEVDTGNTNSKNVPNVIKFMYEESTMDKEKKIQTSKCRRCRAAIREKHCMTSEFVQHVATAAHLCLRSEYVFVLDASCLKNFVKQIY